MHANRNLFPGVNPILNSHLQQPDGGWDAFHARLIGELAGAVDRAVPSGFYAIEEKSLQIHTIPQTAGRRTRPDVAIYQTTKPDMPNPAPQPETATPTLVLPVTEAFTDEDEMPSVVIYKARSGQVPGTPVTRIEVLSPGNKPGGAYHPTYMQKRRETLLTGINLVEIDLLHEAHPILNAIPSYKAQETDAYPYWIMVSDPSPTPAEGRSRIYGTDILEKLPTLALPLVDMAVVIITFQSVYDATFESRQLFPMLSDYDQIPVNFERYTPTDQTAMRDQLTQIRQSNEGQST